MSDFINWREYNPKEPRNKNQAIRSIIDATIFKNGLKCIDNVDMAGVFATESSEDKDGEDYIIIETDVLESLIKNDYIEGVEIEYDDNRYPWIRTDEKGLRLTRNGVEYFILEKELTDNYDNLVLKVLQKEILSWDDELKTKCSYLIVSRKWDTAIREAMLVLESRLRKISGSSNYGVGLVNDCFKENGHLASRFTNSGERQGFRDLFAGVMGIIRNDFAHNFRTLNQDESLEILRFTNLLLQRLESTTA